MNISQSAAGTALSAFNAVLNGGTWKVYQGQIPTSPETAIGSQTQLAGFTFNTPAFAAPTFVSPNMSAAVSFVATSLNPTTGGAACFARAFTSGGVPVADYTISAPWVGGTVVVLGQYVTNGSNLYVCATGGTTAGTGGPTGTGSGIGDGTAVWNWVQAGSSDVTFATTQLLTTVPLAETSFVHTLPAV